MNTTIKSKHCHLFLLSAHSKQHAWKRCYSRLDECLGWADLICVKRQCPKTWARARVVSQLSVILYAIYSHCVKFYTLCAILKLFFLRLTRVQCKNHWVEILSSGFLVSFLPRTVVKIAIFKSTLCILAKIAESHHGQNYQNWSWFQFVPAYYQRLLDAGLMLDMQLLQQINETDNYRRQPRRD